MTPECRLAAEVLAMLDLQQEYFRASGPAKADLLPQCKAVERRVRKLCEAIVRPPKEPAPVLFDNEPAGRPAH